MQTLCCAPDGLSIIEAAGIIRAGGIVAFPTETVYGLGADAFNPDAVKRIYEVKGRPSDNPLIIHICELSQLRLLTETLPKAAERLAACFWPGPMTLIMNKKSTFPSFAASGLPTVAVRFPDNETALSLIRASGTVLAAPSANTSGKPSPTSAAHVLDDMDGRIEMILDGGQTEYGLESTVIDVTGDVPVILRPGAVTYERIIEVVGAVADPEAGGMEEISFAPRSPGMKYRHYAPSAKMTIVSGSPEDVAAYINATVGNGKKIGVLASDQTVSLYDARLTLVSAGDRDKPVSVAANLFSVLRGFDKAGVDEIYSEAFPETGIGLAVMNRLKKAAGYNIIEV